MATLRWTDATPTPSSLSPARALLRRTVELADNQAWSAVASRKGLSIRCDTGSVSITVEGDFEDHVLAAPGRYTLDGRGRVAALALEPARITVERPR